MNQLSPAQYRHDAALWACEALADENAIILDTETTGLDKQAEIIEIAIITMQGTSLLDTLIKPHGKIPLDATDIHGITQADVANAPPWPDIDDRIRQYLEAASRIVIYNAAYDTRLIRQTRQLYNLPQLEIPRQRYECAMQRYAEFYGQWSPQFQRFKWQPLKGGDHRALGDCLATLKVLKRMAETNIEANFA